MHTFFGLSLLLEKPLGNKIGNKNGYITLMVSGKDLFILPLILINSTIVGDLGDIIDTMVIKDVDLILGKRIVTYFRVGKIPALNIKFSFDKCRDNWYIFPIPLCINNEESIDFKITFARKRANNNVKFPKIGIELVEK